MIYTEKKVTGIAATKELFEKVASLVLEATSLKLTAITTQAFEKEKDKSISPVFIFTLPDGTSTGSIEEISHYFMRRLISEEYGTKLFFNSWTCFMQISKEIDQITCEYIGSKV